jgi:hypothetical protein
MSGDESFPTARNDNVQALFNYQKKLEHGTKNAMVARLTVQPVNLLQYCGANETLSQPIIALYATSLIKRLLRCWEIEQRIRANIEKAKAAFKPAKSAVAIEIPHVPRLEEDCQDFLVQFKDFLRELLEVFNQLYGTDYAEASEWIWRTRKHSQPVIDYAVATFGADNLKTRFLSQMKPCNGPFISMRNAIEHAGGQSGTLAITDFTVGTDSRLNEPTWLRKTDGKIVYGPVPILADVANGVHNLFVSGEDLLAMWAMENLMLPGVTSLGVVPEESRNLDCPIKYKLVEGPMASQLVTSTKIG